MPARCRLLAACLLAALPALATAQTVAVKPDGRIGYALAGAASYLSGTTVATRLQLGGQAALATADSQWRIGCKAIWSRTETETTAESMTLQLTQESRHRWGAGTWFWEKLSVLPALRAGEGLRGSFDTGLAIAMTPLLHVNVGVTQRYDSAAGASRGDTRFVTAIAMALR